MLKKSTSDGTKDEKCTNADSLQVSQRSSKPLVSSMVVQFMLLFFLTIVKTTTSSLAKESLKVL